MFRWLLIEGKEQGHHAVITTDETKNRVLVCLLYFNLLIVRLSCCQFVHPLHLLSTYGMQSTTRRPRDNLEPLRGSGFRMMTDSGRECGRGSREAGCDGALLSKLPSLPPSLRRWPGLWPGQVPLPFSVPVTWTETLTHSPWKAALPA